MMAGYNVFVVEGGHMTTVRAWISRILMHSNVSAVLLNAKFQGQCRIQYTILDALRGKTGISNVLLFCL